jgi:hypothetical protein
MINDLLIFLNLFLFYFERHDFGFALVSNEAMKLGGFSPQNNDL